MMLILNRLRGTQGLWSKIIGLLLALVVQIAFGNPYVSIAVGLGYIIGESFGWGEWVGTLSVHQKDIKREMYTMDEGKNNGIAWLASKVFNPETDWINYCRVALTIRGFYWWLPTLAPLYFVGFNPLVLLGCILFLAVGFPIACEIGYLLRDKISFEKYGLEFRGGWEIQEGAYGLMQDLVLITLGVSYVIL